MKRLAHPIAEIRPHYDIVIVGSGYGGGVAASRLARCGRRVCLLERGREFLPGEFPDRLGEGVAEIQVRKDGTHIGSRTGLFDLHTGDDIHVLVGCGLGGTSLINANVSLEPDSRVFKDPRWPTELAGAADLSEGYHRARDMLRPTPIPDQIASNLPKLRALEKAAEALGKECVHPPINVTFDAGPNAANVVQPACELCGDCCSGCNAGSKNTVHLTYLPDAVNHGAELFTEAQVRYLRREGELWRVFYEPAGAADLFDAPERSVTCDIVVLAAGTLGSTEILLRSREHGLATSDRLGTGFTGNGDMLGFSYNNDEVINGIGVGIPPKAEIDPPEVGPCIAGLIEMRDTEDLNDGIVIEEGAIPSPLASILPELMVSTGQLGEDTDFDFGDEFDETKRAFKSLLLGAYAGAVRNTQTFLVMSHDDAQGRIELHGDNSVVSWPEVARQANFVRIDDMLRRASSATGGSYVQNPISRRFLGENLISVHPLGGCSMGKTRATGVVSHKCQVFDASAENDKQVHRGLYVCDGSVMPGPLGVNPLLTISALAERAMIHLAADYGWTFNCEPRPDAPLREARPGISDSDRPAGLEFTERMAGFWSSSVLDDFEAAEHDGERANNTLSFILTIVIDDVDLFVAEPDHPARMAGSVDCPALSSEPLDVSEGRFNLFSIDEQSVEVRRMDYRMTLSDRRGKKYHFIGRKNIHDDPGLDLWSDTTRLFFDLYDDADKHIGRGVLCIAIGDFLTQMRTMHGRGGTGVLDRARAIVKFGRLFGETLYSSYAGPIAPLHRYDSERVRKKRELRTGDPEIYWFNTADGLKLRLARYRGGKKGPVILSHGLGVSSLIFSTDTINTNLVEFLYAAGYDCWLLDYRSSIDLPYATEPWTADDVAREDYPAAIEKVRELTGAKTVQMVVHCYGSTTFVMAMLSGLQHVRSAVISQIAVDVIVPWWPQRLLTYLRVPTLLDFFGLRAVDAKATKRDKWWLKLLDRIIRIALPTQREERNLSATSNRITALYGPLYEHAQLNRLTHLEGLPEMFGRANIKAFRQLAAIARKKHILDASGRDSYRPHLDRLKLPICFIHGAENQCFRPISTKLTYDSLVRRHGTELYERHVIPGYGHIDCIFGKNAAIDVYPYILKHLEKTKDL